MYTEHSTFTIIKNCPHIYERWCTRSFFPLSLCTKSDLYILASSRLGWFPRDYYPFEDRSSWNVPVSHPCLIHDLQGDFIRQRLCSLPFPVGYSAKVPENCKCFATLPSPSTTMLFYASSRSISLVALFPSVSCSRFRSLVSSNTMQWHFSPWIWKFHIRHTAPFWWNGVGTTYPGPLL